MTRWSSTGARRAGCTCSARCWPGHGCGSCGSPPTRRPPRRWRMLAECFETLGGVPKTVLADRMGCLKAGVVANVVVPTADYVRFATHYGFRPDFCEAADPESKGIVENLVGYAKRDLIVPAEPAVDGPARGERGGGCVVRRGQRRGALGDLRGPGRSGWSRNGRCWAGCRRCGPRSAPGRPAARSTSCRACGSGRPATRCRPGSSAPPC